MQTSSSTTERRDLAPVAAAPTVTAPAFWAAHAITASDLQRKTFEPLRYVLPGYIPEGATLLVGRPKLGKSWLVLDLCIAIATGRATLGTVQPATGDVLYLALEDGERRLQRRMATLLSAAAAAWPSRLTLATQWKRADDGGLADIIDWCRSVPKPTAVVIDALDQFRSLRSGQGAGQLYAAVAQLQRIADEHGIAVIIVHHDRKASADDPLDTISGPAGIGGAADTILILKRENRGDIMYVRGRDIEDHDSVMLFDRESCKWTVSGLAARSQERAAAMAILARADRPVAVRDIVSATGSTRAAVDTLLHRMVADGEIVRVAPGRYARAAEQTPADARPLITFTWAPCDQCKTGKTERRLSGT